MNIAAYCRVSTDKADQLNSLEAQKQFFSEYTQRTGDNLVRLYEYSCAVTPQVRQTGNRLSGLAGTAYASLLT